MEECLFTVEQHDDSRWHICEAGISRSLASFGLRDDAVDYARQLGSDGLRAKVVVLQPRGRKREAAEV